MKRAFLLIVVTALIALAPETGVAQQAAGSGGAEKRAVLIIGNGKYADPMMSPGEPAGVLPNVPRDVELLSTSFKAVGFDTEVAQNVTAEELRRRIAQFGERAKALDVAMIYYAGVGIEVDGVNYFAAVDAKSSETRPASLTDVGHVPISDAITAIQHVKAFAMIFAESSRHDPWRSVSRGFTPLPLAEIAGDSDVPVFYGSEEGQDSEDGPSGGHAPFALAVTKRMKEPGIEVGLFARRVRADVIRETRGEQRPKLYGELGSREFYFVNPPKKAEPPPLVFSKQPRLALVIGNGDYNDDGKLEDNDNSDDVRERGFAPDLPNPVNDARDIADALQRLKFDVELVQNANYDRLLNALFKFEKKVLEAGQDAVVVVYYAGHAIQVGGGNFLIPVGATIPPVELDRLTSSQAELVLQRYALPLQTALLERLKNPSRRGLNLIVLDACRENPWERRRGVGRGSGSSRSRGLGEVRIDLRRTAIAFATKPGDTADDGTGNNSPYTLAFKAHVEQPGLSVMDLLNRVHEAVEIDTKGRQIPWMNAPALGKTCLGACADVQ
jgi:uncharacterized caspase-like protein